MDAGTQNAACDTAQVRFGPFVLDPQRRLLTRGGRVVELSGQPLDLLLLLVGRADRLVTRAEIRRLLWPDGRVVDFEQGINACVRDLRRALGDDAAAPAYVRTVPRHGYRFVAPIRVHAARRGLWPGLAAVACVALVALLAWPDIHGPPYGDLPPAAREALVRGEFLLETGELEDPDEAVRAFETAVAAAPGSATAWSGLADAHFYRRTRPGEAFPAALTAVLRALELDADSARALARHAELLFAWQWDFPAADATFRAAIDADPGRAATYHAYAAFLVADGRIQAGIDMMNRALALDPLSVVMHGDLAWFYTLAGRDEDALAQCRLLADIGPANRRVAACPLRALLNTGRLREAAEVARRAIAVAEPDAMPDDALSAAATLDAYWRWRLRRLEAASERGYVEPLALAVTHARLGAPTDARRWLESAYRERSRLAPYAELYPELQALGSVVRPPRLSDSPPETLSRRAQPPRRNP